MNDVPPTPLPHFSLALEVLARLPPLEADLLARELNIFSEAIRTRAGRANFTAQEVLTLFARMHDVARIQPTKAHAVDLDDLADRIAVPTPQITKRRVE